MLNFIVTEDGIINRVEPQNTTRLKAKSNVKLFFTFYKDVNRATLWNLATATIAFSAKVGKNTLTGAIQKANASTDWDKTNAATGVLGLIINDTDLNEARSLIAEIQFQPAGSQRIYKTDDFVIDIIQNVV